MKFNKTKMFSMLIGILILINSSVFAQSLCRVQVMITKDKTKAMQISDKINAAGLGYCEILPSGNEFKILSKQFPTYFEAKIAQKKIADLGFEGLFIVKDNQSGKKGGNYEIFGDLSSYDEKLESGMKSVNGNSDNKTDPQEAAMLKDAYSNSRSEDKMLADLNKFIQNYPDSEKIAQAKLSRGYCLFKKNDVKNAGKQYEEIIGLFPNKPEAGEAALRFGYLKIKTGATDEEVFNTFSKVACGKVPARDNIRAEAMFKCAAIFHHYKDLDSAEESYKAIAKFSRNKQEQAQSLTELAGVKLEQAYNSKCSFDECRQICESTLKKYPDAKNGTKATLDLMAIETLCREGKYSDVVNRSMSFIEKYGETEEYPLGLYWIAKANYETGNLKLSAEILENLLSSNYNTMNRFKYVEVNGYAKKLAEKVYAQLGKIDKTGKK